MAGALLTLAEHLGDAIPSRAEGRPADSTGPGGKGISIERRDAA